MFYFPPRPEVKIPADALPSYEKLGWIAQLKKNGTCQVINIDADGNVEFKTRHNEANKQWTPTREIIEFFAKFPSSVFIAELLHNKTKTVKDKMYVFDVVKFAGKELQGSTLADRLRLLFNIEASEQVLISEVIFENFRDVFNNLSSEEDEGLVLKNPDAKLQSCVKNGLNAGWQVKCRKTTKNYGF